MKYETIFISDIHLGTRGCRAKDLLNFLNNIDCKTLYLVGDVIDVWAMKWHFYWPETHMKILQRLLDIANGTTKVKFIPGNHDEMFHDLVGLKFGNKEILPEEAFISKSGKKYFGNIEILPEDTFISKSGKKYLVLHGDKHDIFHVNFKWISKLCTRFQGRTERLGAYFSSDHRFSKKLKSLVKSATRHINRFEVSIVEEAKERGFDGVLCGHFHSPAHKFINGIEYINDGDWVQNQTVVVEKSSGDLELIDCKALKSCA
ncbi:MAG: UDP-2,3-diacylglucosamine hydrolase [Rickettsiales bacterium]|nr:UDP-2,3-diacylglucosamine hydrolase [Rickettsiales bacterium]|tara:strand:- start:6890 stop:7669 length:780 start_codon:yes stop_codon:yes gene_type:complete